ncbi:hypothetical protein [Agrobacterium sp. LAD9]|uniref:hypothetical protein n=1 Tax=Agrobacterium sp. LAD9 TaxID=2055153 RepID=UPI000D1F9944|nr:hypothetical protein [Agrobacterium sp. LAD9]
MTGITKNIDDFDILEDASGYARPSEDFGESEVSQDHVANLEKLREMLIKRRRYLIQDAMVYPVTYISRAMDLAKMQPLIEAIERAIHHEQKLLQSE